MRPTYLIAMGLALASLLSTFGCVGPSGQRASTGQLSERDASRSSPDTLDPLVTQTSLTETVAGVATPTVHTASREQGQGGGDSEIAPTAEESEEAADIPPELTLQDAIDLTLAANPDLQSAVERTMLAEDLLARARADFFPTLSLSQGFEDSNNDLRKFTFFLSQNQNSPTQLFNLPDTYNNFHTQLHLQHDLYTGGMRQARSRSAEAEREAARFSLQSARNRIAFQVAEAYFRLFQARELVKVREESVRQVENELESVQARFRAQTATQSDVLQVEVRLAQEREALITTRSKFKLAWAVLENITATRLANRPLPETLPLAPWTAHADQLLGQQTAADESATEKGPLAAEAEAGRPEIGEVTSRLQAAQHMVRAAESGKYPVLSFIGDYDIYSADFREQTTDGAYYVGVTLSISLFDGGRTKANVRQAQARVRELTAQEQRVRLDITLEARQAYLQFVDASERLKMARVAMTSGEESLRQMESRFNNQNATVTDLLAAQVALSEARVRVTNASAEIEVARAAIERAVGRLGDLLCPNGTPTAGPPLPLAPPPITLSNKAMPMPSPPPSNGPETGK